MAKSICVDETVVAVKPDACAVGTFDRVLKFDSELSAIPVLLVA